MAQSPDMQITEGIKEQLDYQAREMIIQQRNKELQNL